MSPGSTNFKLGNTKLSNVSRCNAKLRLGNTKLSTGNPKVNPGSAIHRQAMLFSDQAMPNQVLAIQQKALATLEQYLSHPSSLPDPYSGPPSTGLTVGERGPPTKRGPTFEDI